MALSKVDLANQVENQLPQNLVANNLPFRNIIINGDMSIAQRGTSATGITDGNTYHTVDRMRTQVVTAGTWTQTQDTDVPTGQGFTKSLKMDCTTADASLGADDFLIVRQDVEGQNLQYLKYGTSNAESVTMSFWVKSNKTGTYIIWLYAPNASNRQISKSYTINTADTWEKKTITFAGDTAQAFTNDNDSRLRVYFILAAGSNSQSGTLATSWENYVTANRAVGQVNLADSTSNYINITGIQLEAGTTASDFEFLPVDMNLARCQRYYQVLADGSEQTQSMIGTGLYFSASLMVMAMQYYTEMRATPSLDNVSGTNYYRIFANNTNDYFDDFFLISPNSTNKVCDIRNQTDVSGTAGTAGFVRTENAASFLAFDAEL